MSIKNKYPFKLLMPLVLAGVLLFILKFFFIDIAKVNSQSMGNALTQNSWVFVKPYTILSSEIKQNDIVQLSLPLYEKDSIVEKGLFFKRIIALPGDTVNINQSVVFVNGKALEGNGTFLHNYVIKTKLKSDTNLFAQLGITSNFLIDDSCVYIVSLTNDKFKELKNKSIEIKKNTEDSGLYDETIFPYNKQFTWNKDFFGKLYIPKKGYVITLDTTSIKLYARILIDFENNILETKENKVLINGMEATNYTVQQNYYFAIGDNFDNSIDSRHWGFIPENKIKTKLLFGK